MGAERIGPSGAASEPAAFPWSPCRLASHGRRALASSPAAPKRDRETQRGSSSSARSERPLPGTGGASPSTLARKQRAFGSARPSNWLSRHSPVKCPNRSGTLGHGAASNESRAQGVSKRARTAGSGCIWPRGLRDRYGISGPTLWRWERAGKLPRRDVHIGGRAVGWRPDTIERAEQGDMV